MLTTIRTVPSCAARKDAGTQGVLDRESTRCPGTEFRDTDPDLGRQRFEKVLLGWDLRGKRKSVPGRGQGGFQEKGRRGHRGVQMMFPCQCSGTLTIQARRTQKREKYPINILIKVPSLL